MENKLYLIHEDDYIKHIEEKAALYSMLKQITRKVAKLPSNRGNKNLSVLTKKAEAIADKMFHSWSIPASYLYTGDSDELFFQMENDLIAPEDAGYFAYSEECCGNCECCCQSDDFDYDAYDFEVDEDEHAAFQEMMSSLTAAVHQFFGGNVTVNIVVE